MTHTSLFASRPIARAALLAALTVGACKPTSPDAAYDPITEEELAALAPALVYAPDVGKEAVHRVHFEGTARLDYASLAALLSPDDLGASGEQEERAHRFTFDAELHQRVVAREGAVTVVAMRLVAPHLVVDGQDDPRRVYDAPFFVRFAHDAAITDVRFAPGTPDDVRATVTKLVAPLGVGFAPEAREFFVNDQTDEAVSTVRFEIVGLDPSSETLHLSRTLMASRRQDDLVALGGVGGVETMVSDADGHVAWSLSGDGVRSASVRHTLTLMSGLREIARETNVVELDAIAKPVERLPASEPAAFTGADALAAARAELYQVSAQGQAALRGFDDDGILAYYQAHYGDREKKVTAKLVDYVRLHPEVAPRFARHFGAMCEDAALREMGQQGLATIAGAGHVEAQAALRDLIADLSAGEYARDLAVRALFNVRFPEPFLLPVVWAYRESITRSGPADWRTRLSIATNVYGALGAIERAVPENTSAVAATLTARLSSTTNARERRLMLVALGNVGDLSLTLPAVEPYFTDEDEDTRRRAFNVFHKAPGDDAFEKFRVRFEAEDNAQLRRDAVAIAVRMAPGAARTRWLAELSTRESDTRILVDVVHMLARERELFPENEGVLRHMLDTVRDREVRKTLYLYLRPVAPGSSSTTPSPDPGPPPLTTPDLDTPDVVVPGEVQP